MTASPDVGDVALEFAIARAAKPGRKAKHWKRMRALLVLPLLLLLSACAAHVDPTPQAEPAPRLTCYLQALPTETRVHCVDPTPNLAAASCVPVSDPTYGAPCDEATAGLACRAVDADTWYCSKPCALGDQMGTMSDQPGDACSRMANRKGTAPMWCCTQ